MKYLAIFHSYSCNKLYYISREISIEHPSVGLASLAQLHTLYYTLHTEHAYYTVIEMVEMVEILDGRLGKRLVERVRYVINNLLHLVIVKYGVINPQRACARGLQ